MKRMILVLMFALLLIGCKNHVEGDFKCIDLDGNEVLTGNTDYINLSVNDLTNLYCPDESAFVFS